MLRDGETIYKMSESKPKPKARGRPKKEKDVIADTMQIDTDEPSEKVIPKSKPKRQPRRQKEPEGEIMQVSTGEPSETVTKTPIIGNELKGEVKKKWVQFMKDYKKWALEQNLTGPDITAFAKHYYKTIASAPDQNKALDDFIKNFKSSYPFESRIITEVNPEKQEATIEDLLDHEKEEQLTEPQIKHIQGVIKVLKKEPELKADIKRTITEELTKGTINPTQFKEYNNKIENAIIESEAPIAIRGELKVKPKKDKQKKKPKVVTL